MNESWLRQWTDKGETVIRRAKSDVEKNPGGGNATLSELQQFIQAEGKGKWTLLEVDGYYIVIKKPTPTITKHLGTPTLV